MAETILYLAHTEADGRLGKAQLEALAAAQVLSQSLGAPFTAGLIGGDITAAAQSIGGCGAAKFLAVAGAEFAQARYASDAAAVEALCRQSGASLVLAAATSRWSRVLPGAAQRLGGQSDTFVTNLSVEQNQPVVTRWFYRQRMAARLIRNRRPWLITLAPGSFNPAALTPSAPAVETLAVNLPDGCRRTKVTGMKASAAGAQTIRPDAELLFVAGAGWTKKQADGQFHLPKAEKLILDFIQKSQASLGSSKSMVDLAAEGEAVLAFLTHLHQIGQTGSTPCHKKGLATCCHGEEPHAVGWRFINERRAINLDPNCGWAQGKTDVLYVADAFKVMAQVNTLLAG